jgi:ribosomal-protein-alanine N-acetyltransferase
MATAVQHLPLPQLMVRRMTEADVPAVSAIETASYRFPWSAAIFRDCLRAGYLCQVIELDTQLIGYGILSVAADEAHILNICIRPEQRCRGIGARLLHHLLELSRGRGARVMFLEVRPSNLAAARLYHSLGFEQVGIRRGYYQAENGREDAIVMRLSITHP